MNVTLGPNAAESKRTAKKTPLGFTTTADARQQNLDRFPDGYSLVTSLAAPHAVSGTLQDALPALCKAASIGSDQLLAEMGVRLRAFARLKLGTPAAIRNHIETDVARRNDAQLEKHVAELIPKPKPAKRMAPSIILRKDPERGQDFG